MTEGFVEGSLFELEVVLISDIDDLSHVQFWAIFWAYTISYSLYDKACDLNLNSPDLACAKLSQGHIWPIDSKSSSKWVRIKQTRSKRELIIYFDVIFDV